MFWVKKTPYSSDFFTQIAKGHCVDDVVDVVEKSDIVPART